MLSPIYPQNSSPINLVSLDSPISTPFTNPEVTPIGIDLFEYNNSSPSRLTGSSSTASFNILFKLTLIAEVNLNTTLDLKRIHSNLRFSELSNHKDRKTLSIKLSEPRSTAVLYENGKMVCVSSPDSQSLLLAARKFARMIQKQGYPVKFSGFRVRSITGAMDFGMKLDLNQIFHKNKHNSYYDPEVIDYLIVYYNEENVKMIVHGNGKVMMFGLKSVEHVQKMQELILRTCMVTY